MEDKPRSKVSKACTFCKQRKRRCDGQHPCSFCISKGNADCTFDILDKRSIRYSHWKKGGHVVRSFDSSRPATRPSPEQNPIKHTTATNSSYVVNGLYRQSPTNSNDITSTTSDNDTYSAHQLSPEEGGSTRMLMDNNGNMRFIGESSPLSLLAQTRRMFSWVSIHGLAGCKFVNDPRRFNIWDAPDSQINHLLPIALPLRKRCDELVGLFITNVNRLTYVFSEKYLKRKIVDLIYQDPTKAPYKKLCQLYIVLAIGSLYSRTISQDGNEDHIKFYKSAMNILNNTVQDGNLWLVEVHLLSSFFYQASSKRNTSWLILGMAIRIAESLGLNRRKANDSCTDKEYAIHRRKLWRSLYVMDRLTSIILGRPLSINNITWDDDRNSIPISTNQDQNLLDVCESQLVKLCDLNGEIYEKIYYSSRIDSDVAYDLAVRLKTWCESLPSALQAENLLKLKNLDTLDKEKMHDERYSHHPLLLLHLVHFNGVILLSKPFFHYYITRALQQALQVIDPSRETTSTALNSNTSIIRSFAESCVNAAVFTVKFSWFYVKNNMHPLKPYNMINNVFNSGLILGLVTLSELLQWGDNGVKTEYKSHLESLKVAIQILKEFASVDSFARRYTVILGDIEAALYGVIKGIRGDGQELEAANGAEDSGAPDLASIAIENDVLDKLNDLDDWLFGSILGDDHHQQYSLGSDGLEGVDSVAEMDLLNAFMVNMSNNDGVDLLSDHRF